MDVEECPCDHDFACMDASTYDLSETKIMTVHPEHRHSFTSTCIEVLMRNSMEANERSCDHDFTCMDASTYDLSETKIMTVHPEHRHSFTSM